MKHRVENAVTSEEYNAPQLVSEMELRFERVKELYLTGELNREIYEAVKLCIENVRQRL